MALAFSEGQVRVGVALRVSGARGGQRLLFTSVFGALSSCLPSCGEPDAEAAESSELVSVTERLLDAACKADVACGAFPDVETCRPWFGSEGLNLNATQAAIERGSVIYHADLAEQCIATIEQSPPICAYSDSVPAGSRDSCATWLEGTVPDGAPCMVSAECRTGYCEQDCAAGCCQGICVSSSSGIALGQDCSTGFCANGTWCQEDPTTLARTCAPRVPEGAACTSQVMCAQNSFCAMNTDASGVCTRFPEEGAVCTLLSICTETDCEFSAPCDRFNNYCDATTGTCQPLPGEGAICDSEQCADWLECMNGVCTRRPPPQEAACQ